MYFNHASILVLYNMVKFSIKILNCYLGCLVDCMIICGYCMMFEDCLFLKQDVAYFWF